MSKASKQRQCPAVNRTISSQECGEKRNTEYKCPQDCSFNPFAPANYEAFLELEQKVEHACMQAVKEEQSTRERIQKGLDRIDQDRLDQVVSVLNTEMFFRRGADGRTWAERWRASGYGNWKSEMRVLFEAKAAIQPRLLEVLEVRKDEMTVTDLLEPERGSFVFRDKIFAARACRFDTLLALVYDTPFFSRAAPAIFLVQEMGRPVLESLLEIARHLGAPEQKEGLRRWVVEHLGEMLDAIRDTMEARHAASMNAVNANFARVVYGLRAPFAECRDVLDEIPEVSGDSLTIAEKSEGFAEGRIWFEDGQDPAFGVTIGRVLLGQANWRLEAMGEERANKLRSLFEKALGERVEFQGMRLDDLRNPAEAGKPSSLVPPKLMENLNTMMVSANRLDLTALRRPGEATEETVLRVMDEQFLLGPVPALDGKTAAEAAVDPILRPRLIALLKQRLNGTDRRNLEEGTHYDPQWMLEKLGIGDCFPPPPPARPRLKKEADYENEDDASGEWPDVPSGRRLAPAVPVGGARPIGESMEIVLEDFPSFAEAAEEIEDAGCPWLWLAEEMLGDTVGAAEMEALKGCLTQAWFAMVPVGAFVRSISVECIQENFDKIFDDFEEGQPEPERIPKPLTSAFQDALVQGTFTLLNVTLQGQKPDSAALFDCWVFLKAAIDELHEALEEQNRSGR